MRTNQRSIGIRQFIIHNVGEHPDDIARVVADHYEITQQAARNHLKSLELDGTLKSSGRTKAKRYELVKLADYIEIFKTSGLQEDIVWSEHLRPKIEAPPNIIDVCGIAVSEMVNNAIDHSESETVTVSLLATASTIDICIHDKGVGVFKKVRSAFNLIDERQAILELAKGKLTTAPQEHSGYGIFFTSRMVDWFRMRSGSLFFTHLQNDGDWLIEAGDDLPGTFVEMIVSTNSKRTAASIYNEFCQSPETSDLGFTKTHVPLKLAQFGSESLVSRSQAKRVLSRFERFHEVMLDFRGVDVVGQGFIDEIFRVFRHQHPEVVVKAINTNKLVDQLIHLAQSIEGRPHQLNLFEI